MEQREYMICDTFLLILIVVKVLVVTMFINLSYLVYISLCICNAKHNYVESCLIHVNKYFHNINYLEFLSYEIKYIKD